MYRDAADVSLRERLPGCLRRGETACFEALELLSHGPFDDRRQIAVRHLVAHQRLQPLQLVVKGSGRSELDLVAGGREGLDDGARSGQAWSRTVDDSVRTESILILVRTHGLREWCGFSSGTLAHHRQLPHDRRNIGPRRELSHELLDPTFRPVGSPGEHEVAILRGQMWRQQADTAQVKPPLGEQGQEHGVLPGGAGRDNAQVGLGFGEVKDLGAVTEHRSARMARVELSLVDLGDVRDEISFGPT
jgi:hypothetical protein